MAYIRHLVLIDSPELDVVIAWDDEPFDADLPSPELLFRVDLSAIPDAPGPGGWRRADVRGIEQIRRSLLTVLEQLERLMKTRDLLERWWSESNQGPPPGV